MKRSIQLSSLAIALSIGLVAAAQTPPAAEPQTDEKTITVAGCLAVKDDEPGRFVLTNVTPDPEVRGTTGIERPEDPEHPEAEWQLRDPEVTYELIGTGDLNLEAHVGHKVEITGMVVPPAVGTAGPDEPEPVDDEEEVQRLNVQSLQHISETCPEQ